MVISLVIAGQVNVQGVSVLKAEDHAPIGPDSHSPETFEAAFEAVRPKARQTHVTRLAGTVQNGEYIFDFLYVIGLYAFRFTLLKQPLQPLMPETLNQQLMLS